MMSFPDPNFIDRDPEAITADLVARYEYLSGKTLYPAQVERLLIDLIAYAKTMTHIGIQEAGKQNLVRFARAPMLDYLGELVRTPRLFAGSAKTMLRFSIPASLSMDVTMPGGTLVDSSDGKVTFATDAAATLAAGALFVDVAASCTTAGIVGNGWQLGQINALASDVGDVVVSVVNTTVSADGADDEVDDLYRIRVMEGTEAYSVAGPRAAYRFHAMSAHQDIIDVGIVGPELVLANGRIVSTNQVPPGAVFVYPLVKTGVPDENILSLVQLRLSDEKVRPLCDFPQVYPITPVDYAIDAALWILDTSAETSTSLNKTVAVANARKAVQDHAAYLSAGVGRDVVVNDFIAKLKVSGVYDVSLPSLPGNLVLGGHQWARCTGINVYVAGVKHG